MREQGEQGEQGRQGGQGYLSENLQQVFPLVLMPNAQCPILRRRSVQVPNAQFPIPHILVSCLLVYDVPQGLTGLVAFEIVNK